MSILTSFGLLIDPESKWKTIKVRNPSTLSTYLGFLVIMALIPPVCAYLGSTKVGWKIGAESFYLTPDSALQLSIAAYFALLAGVFVVAKFIQLMAKTFGADPSLSTCMALTAYSSTPLFLAGLAGAYPVMWVDMVVTLFAIGLAVFLLYTGVPVMMDIEKERGFLFSSSILTIAMVTFVGMLGVTAIFWGSGIAPVVL